MAEGTIPDAPPKNLYVVCEQPEDIEYHSLLGAVTVVLWQNRSHEQALAFLDSALSDSAWAEEFIVTDDDGQEDDVLGIVYDVDSLVRTALTYGVVLAAQVENATEED